MTYRASPLAHTVIGLAIEVHRLLGPGLLESIYARCLMHELTSANLRFEPEVAIPVRYKGLSLEYGYRADLIIEDVLLIEVKSVDCLLPVHSAQTLTYMKMAGVEQALLFNFNVLRLVDGLRSFVN